MNWKMVVAAAAVLGIAAGSADAAPSVKRSGNTFTIVEALTDEGAAQIKAEMSQVDQSRLTFNLKDVKDEELAKFCAAYPNIPALSIDSSKELTSIAPLASLKALKNIKIRADKVQDFTPLAGLAGLERLDVGSKAMGPDLKWMSGMTKLGYVSVSADKALTSFEGLPSLPALRRASLTGAAPADLTPVLALSGLEDLLLNYCTIKDLTPLTKLAKLKDLSLYGATVQDFSPLAGCASLKRLTYYAAKDADFSTLGKLTQVETLNGGLTKLDNIDWVANLPNLKKFDVFAEYVKDYAPLGKTSVENFQIWSMRVPVDLKSLAGAVSLKQLKLWNLKDVSGFEGLAPLVNLEELTLDEVNKDGTIPVDYVKGMSKLAKLNLSRINCADTAALGSLPALKELKGSRLNNVGDKPFDLGFVGKLPMLKSLSLDSANISGLESLASCAQLESVSLTKVTGVTSLAPLKKVAGLKRLTVTKGAFPDSELTGFDEKVKINQR